MGRRKTIDIDENFGCIHSEDNTTPFSYSYRKRKEINEIMVLYLVGYKLYMITPSVLVLVKNGMMSKCYMGVSKEYIESKLFITDIDVNYKENAKNYLYLWKELPLDTYNSINNKNRHILNSVHKFTRNELTDAVPLLEQLLAYDKNWNVFTKETLKRFIILANITEINDDSIKLIKNLVIDKFYWYFWNNVTVFLEHIVKNHECKIERVGTLSYIFIHITDKLNPLYDEWVPYISYDSSKIY